MDALHHFGEVGGAELEFLDDVGGLFDVLVGGEHIDEEGSAGGVSFNEFLGLVDRVALDAALQHFLRIEFVLEAEGSDKVQGVKESLTIFRL